MNDFVKFENETNDLIISFENNLLINGKIIAAQNNDNEWIEGPEKWIQEYSSIFWKTLIDNTVTKDHNGKADFESIVEDLGIFLQDIKK